MAYNMLGIAHGREKMYEEEKSAYTKAISIKPDFAQGHFNLGIVLGIQKKFETAAPHFLKAIELDKQFEKPFVIQMLTALGLYDSASENRSKKTLRNHRFNKQKLTPLQRKKKLVPKKNLRALTIRWKKGLRKLKIPLR